MLGAVGESVNEKCTMKGKRCSHLLKLPVLACSCLSINQNLEVLGHPLKELVKGG